MGAETILTGDEPVVESTTAAVVEDAGDGETTANTDNTDDSGEAASEEVVYDEFTLPEGVVLDDETLSSAAELFKEAGLTKEQAQKFVDLQVAANQKAEDKNATIRQEWSDKSKSDKEYGGDKFNESIASANQALEKFGTPEFKDMLNETGVGDHPEMIRLLKRVGDLTKEDNPLNPGKAPIKKLSRAEQLYPNN